MSHTLRAKRARCTHSDRDRALGSGLWALGPGDMSRHLHFLQASQTKVLLQLGGALFCAPPCLTHTDKMVNCQTVLHNQSRFITFLQAEEKNAGLQKQPRGVRAAERLSARCLRGMSCTDGCGCLCTHNNLY